MRYKPVSALEGRASLDAVLEVLASLPRKALSIDRRRIEEDACAEEDPQPTASTSCCPSRWAIRLALSESNIGGNHLGQALVEEADLGAPVASGGVC